MKNKITNILLGIIIIGLGFNIIYTKNLKKDISELENNINRNYHNQDSMISNDMNSLKSEINTLLKKSQSILTSYNTELRYENDKIVLHISFIPKEYQNSDTAEIICNGEAATAVHTNGVFVGEISIEPTNQSISPTIKIYTENNIKQETLDEKYLNDFFSLYTNTFPKEEIVGFSESEIEKNTFILQYSNENIENATSFLAKDISISIIDRDINKEIAKINMTPSDNKTANDVKNNWGFSEGYVYEADLGEFREKKGNFIVQCDLVTESGLHYNFEMATFENYENGSNASWGNESIVPIFN